MMDKEVLQLALPLEAQLITVHCFFRKCPHVAQSVNPQEAHDLMEKHYQEKHSQQIEQIVKYLG